MSNFFVSRLQKLNWSIRSKVGAAFILILACLVVDGLISVFLLVNIKGVQARQQENASSQAQLQRFELAYQSELNLYSSNIFVTRSRFVQDDLQQLIIEALQPKNLQEGDAANQDFKMRFAQDYDIAMTDLTPIDDLLKSSQFDEAGKKWHASEADFKQLTDLLQARRSALDDNHSLLETELSSNIFLAIEVIGGLTLISLGLILIILYLFERVLVRPLNTLQKALLEMAGGNLDQRLEVVNRDEVGKLSDSFKQALSSLQQVLKGVQIGESLHQVIGQLASVSQQQASGSSLQVSALVEVTTAMQQLSQTAGQIASHSSRVAELIGTTHQQIERVAEAGEYSRGRASQMVQVVERTMSGVERVGNQVKEIRQVMSELDEQAEAVGKVVKLLAALASEVHLLSLNASIEASSAGMFGERFKEVAGHVKQLANRANQATLEAKSLIEAMQLSSRAALTQVAAGHGEIEKIVEDNSNMGYYLRELEESAGQVGSAVAELVDLAGQVSHQTEEIRQATQEQYTSSTQVIAAAHSVEEVASQTSHASQEIARSSSVLNKLSVQLNGVLGQVKLGAVGPASS